MIPPELVTQEVHSCLPENVKNMKKWEIGRGYSPHKSCNVGRGKMQRELMVCGTVYVISMVLVLGSRGGSGFKSCIKNQHCLDSHSE